MKATKTVKSLTMIYKMWIIVNKESKFQGDAYTPIPFEFDLKVESLISFYDGLSIDLAD